ncbi:hypothetical protein ACROYT_G004752 [Oculina patagonica]
MGSAPGSAQDQLTFIRKLIKHESSRAFRIKETASCSGLGSVLPSAGIHRVLYIRTETKLVLSRVAEVDNDDLMGSVKNDAFEFVFVRISKTAKTYQLLAG